MSQAPTVHSFNRAIVRRPAQSVCKGLRAHDGGDPSYAGVSAEHDAYVAALRGAGVDVEVLAPLEDFPDSVFVEDPALVFTEGAILLRPGAPSRRGETEHLAPSLRARFEVVLDLPADGFADGGDVLTTPGSVMIGLSDRTDRAGAEALRARLDQLGRKGEIVATPPGVLHFKTGCALVDEETVLCTRPFADSRVFRGRFRELIVSEGEDGAANALRVNDALLVGAEFPRTIERLDRAGHAVVPMNVAEINRIDAGLSCMSLRWFAADADR